MAEAIRLSQWIMAIANNADNSLHEQTEPLHPVDVRLTNDDPLSTRIECGFERSGHFTLCSFVAFGIGGQSKCRLERLRKQGWRKPQGSGAPSHHRPFLSCGLLNVAADEGAQARFRFARKSSRKNHDGSERARFTIDRRIGPFVVVPDLRRSERDKKAEDNAQWREHSGGNALNARARSPFARAVTSP